MGGKIGIKSTWKICSTCQDEFLGLTAEECQACRRKRSTDKSSQYKYIEYGKKTEKK